MPSDMFSLIKKELDSTTEERASEQKLAYLIFFINKKLYALPSSAVKEILRDAVVFALPFSPAYLNGVLNRYGDPYAVIDPALLIQDSPQDSQMFITLNDDSHTCLKITDVKEFFTIRPSDLNSFKEAELSEYFDGTLTAGMEEILILKTNAFLERLTNDIKNS